MRLSPFSLHESDQYARVMIDPLFRAADFGQLWRMEEAHAALQELLNFLPDFLTTGRERLRRIVFWEDHEEKLWDGLRKAGL